MRASVNPVTWVTDNPIIWVVLVAGASWISKFLRARGSRGQLPGAPPAGDEAERTRRVQEEVRRRIAERRSGAALPVPPQPAPRPPSADETQAVLARQRLLEDQMRALDAARDKSASAARAARVAAAVPPPLAPSYDWFAELRDPRGMRRGIILREVLGPPVGLR